MVINFNILFLPIFCLFLTGKHHYKADLRIFAFKADNGKGGKGVKAQCAAAAEIFNALMNKENYCLFKGFFYLGDFRLGKAAVAGEKAGLGFHILSLHIRYIVEIIS